MVNTPNHIRCCIPTRSVLWIMLFTCTFMLYLLRINFSIIILGMVNPATGKNNEVVIPECAPEQYHIPNNSTLGDDEHTKIDEKFDWDTKLQGLMLSAYFWGFTISGFPGGAISEKFGPARTITFSFLSSGVLTLLAPFAASVHPSALIVSRFFTGLLSGVVYPGMHCLIARWAPPAEKGKFVASLLGGSLATILTWPLLGKVVETIGWQWAFYISGIITLVWLAIWTYLVYDRPDIHPRISGEEKTYIVESLAGAVSNTKKLAPYREMILSVPFWALTVLHFGNLWGLFFLMTAGPNFMSTVLGFNLGHTGILAALPYLARLFSGFIFGSIGDAITHRDLMKRTTIRKSFVFFSHILPGILLFTQTLVGCNLQWTIALITLSLGFNGASTLTCLQNSQDLAPNFAGSVYGIINAIGSMTGFINPLIVGYLTAEHNGMDEWHTIFYIGASVYIGCGIVFCIFGSGDIQPWNNIEDKIVRGTENFAFEDVTVKTGTER